MTDDDRTHLHQAIQETLDEGELAVAWTLTVDVAGPDGTRYLAHRFGAGHDGTDPVHTWTVLGMLRSSVIVAEDQILEISDSDDVEDDE